MLTTLASILGKLEVTKLLQFTRKNGVTIYSECLHMLNIKQTKTKLTALTTDFWADWYEPSEKPKTCVLIPALICFWAKGFC